MLRYGNRNEEFSASILVVSSDAICEKISDALYSCSKKQDRYKLSVHQCKRVIDVLNTAPMLGVDLIVFGLDTRVVSCLDEVEVDIKMSSIAFSLGRMCFVCDSSIRPTEMTVSHNDIWDLQRKYGGFVLVGDVANEAKCLHLAERILKLVVAATGVNSGLPYTWRPELKVNSVLM